MQSCLAIVILVLKIHISTKVFSPLYSNGILLSKSIAKLVSAILPALIRVLLHEDGEGPHETVSLWAGTVGL